MVTKEKWFEPRKSRGWKKTQKASTRRRKLLDSTDKRKSMRNRYIEAGRSIQSLANVNTGPKGDPETRRKARSDAKYFFDKVD